MIEFTTASKDGTDLFGRHWPVENPNAVMALVHGFGEHCGRYGHMAAHLNTKGIAVVAVDLRGHGRSSGKRGVIKSYVDFREDLDALLMQTRGLYPDVPLVLYGHSMGGGIVLDYGMRTPDEELPPIIASAPLLSLVDPVPKLLRIAVRFLGKILPNGGLSQPIDGTKISNLANEQALYVEDPLNHGKLSFRLAEGMVSMGEYLSADSEFWDSPLLLLHSKADQLTSYECSSYFADDAFQVEFHTFETSQHEMHNDVPRAQIYDLITEFTLRQTS